MGSHSQVLWLLKCTDTVKHAEIDCKEENSLQTNVTALKLFDLPPRPAFQTLPVSCVSTMCQEST
jgi:hypothetical protein